MDPVANPFAPGAGSRPPSPGRSRRAARSVQEGIQTLIGEDHAARLYGHPLVLVDLLAHDENSVA